MNIQGTIPAEARAVLDFWFVESGPEKWFVRDEAFDGDIRDRFGPAYRRAYDGDLGEWIETAEGCLALVIVLDQFPRNLFRDDPRAFGTDPHARILLQYALDKEFDKALDARQRQFLYMPLQHSEDRQDQELSVELNAALGNDGVLKFAQSHKDIIDRFGRFPHRNEVLGRESTAEETEFLAQPGSSF
ncbi:MAG: DUF924 domain-containing protein [Alphaproteobacteria bacterium]|nr:DUF924 domain-containing protein [Alphaproteobacteria bacterium]